MCFSSACFSEGVTFTVSGASGSSAEGLVEGSRGFLGSRIFTSITSSLLVSAGFSSLTGSGG